MKTILITGSLGFIGSYLAFNFKEEYKIISIDSTKSIDNHCDYFYDINITDYKKINEVFENHVIDYVIHTAAEKSLVACEKNKERAYEINFLASEYLCNITKANNGRFIFISSDQVFDGKLGNYLESSKANPINYYGVLKEIFENKYSEDAAVSICRTALTFGKIPDVQTKYFNQVKLKDFLSVQGYIVQHVIYKLSNKEYINLPENEYLNPTSVELLCCQIKKVIEHEVSGILHCCGSESISRYEFGKKIAKLFELDDSFIKSSDSNDKLRPKNVSLNVDYSSNRLGMTYWNVDKMLEILRPKII